MPEPKQSKRTYEAQSESAVAGLRLVSQRAEQADARRAGPGAAPGQEQEPGDLPAPEPELVSKLIRFFKDL